MFIVFFLSVLCAQLLSGVAFSEQHTFSPEVLHKIKTAQEGVGMRWEVLCREKSPFAIWRPDWKKEDLKVVFDHIMKERFALYFTTLKDWKWGAKSDSTPHYQSALLDGCRNPYTITFAYNLAAPDYNASIIHINGDRFLAFEAPRKSNLKQFFYLLEDYNVTDLVRLTPAFEVLRDRESCFPYWEGRTDIHPVTGTPTLHVKVGRLISYFPTDRWDNHMGVEPKKLLALIKAVMRSSLPERKTIAVHCHAGVGRTGTFIAGYALIRDIKRQLARGVRPENLEISVEKMVWELSVQRPFLVTHLPQYVTLYQLVELYLSSL